MTGYKGFMCIILSCMFISHIRPQEIQIRDGWYFIDGAKFFVKGIGYETHTRPGQVPWVYTFDADLITFDLNRIREAGYNTIRTWGALSEEELQLVESSGLKLLFGIWIDPHGDFGDAGFRTSALNQVSQVLSYSKKYKCIIGYLIMNEPLVEHIYDKGAGNLYDLWQSVITLIHTEHPGIPVSFSNTMIGDYINMDIFDFAGYNAYIYNPVTLSGSHGYGGYLNYLKQHRAPAKPMIITEFGLSVSPGIPQAEYGYGGNTLDQQVSGDLLMYRELIDAGAQGGCVFQYHDGWWKGGNEFIHDPVAEEWFGLIGFSDLADKFGAPRPVWQAFAEYNQAVITSPVNGGIYEGIIPLEFFVTDAVASYSVAAGDTVILSGRISETCYTDSLEFQTLAGIADVDLVFTFYNAGKELVKTEQVYILLIRDAIELPAVELEVIPADLMPGGQNSLRISVISNPVFSIEENEIAYVLHPHIGFDPGLKRTRIMQFSGNAWSYLAGFNIPYGTRVATFGAGFTIRYGKFTKRISGEKILIDGNWADAIAAPELVSGLESPDIHPAGLGGDFSLYQNYPNPFNPRTCIGFYLPKTGHVTIRIYNNLGQLVRTVLDRDMPAGEHRIEFNGQEMPSGVYWYKLETAHASKVKKMLLLR